jgi:3-hydroxyisobutyrate dehydrogenase-like beta-hydroxyacid dehydrogenase
MKIAVFGLGIIGGIWAKHYAADGVLSATWNRSAKPGAPHWHPDALSAALAGEVLQIVVADPPAVEAVLNAIVPALGPDKLVVQSSTIDPDSSRRFAALVRATGAGYVEGPFTGSQPAAEARQTIFYLGGEPSLIERVEPLLARVSGRRFRIGSEPQAAALKLAMNLQIATVMQALAEGLVFARRAGIEDQTFFDVLKSNVACSGLVDLKGPKLRGADFAAQFSIKHLLKDLRLARATPGGAELPATALLTQVLQAAAARGWEDQDFSALFKLL